MVSRVPVSSLLVLSFLLLLQVEVSQPCLCSILKNFKCPSAPACCESGQYTLDECGCCQKCAKAELQKCGGASDVSGKCSSGLQCLKTCLPCKTVGDAGKPCIFPFKYADQTYNSCTSKDSDTGQPWCATEVDHEGYVVDNAWGDCLDGCPGTRVECDDKYFSIQEGKCIDISVPGAIPNWFGAPAVKLEPPTRDLFPAPACKAKKGSVRFYDNTCRCVRGESAIDLGHNGQIRGNCTGLEDDDTDNLDKVWCFLENIRDPLNPTSGCYSDTKWSERDARFWSSLACFQAPDIEGREKATISRGFSNHIDEPYRPTTRKTRTTTTTLRTTTTVRTTTRALAIGEIEQYSDNSEHFYFSDYYQDYHDQTDSDITVSEDQDYEENYQVDPHNDKWAKPNKLSDKSYTFVVGETNLPGFGRETEISKGEITTLSTSTTQATTIPPLTFGPFLPTPAPAPSTTTISRRNLLRNRFRSRNRARRPPNANPRRKPPAPKPNKRILATRFPNFRRRPQILRRTTERTQESTIPNDISEEEIGLIAESPRSFLEGEFGENNIPIAIPLFENGELSDDIFKKIKKPNDAKLPVPPLGSVLAKVETEKIKSSEKKKKHKNILEKIPRTNAPQHKESENNELEIFGKSDVLQNEITPKDSDLVDFDIQKKSVIEDSSKNEDVEATDSLEKDEQQAPLALPFILEEEDQLHITKETKASMKVNEIDDFKEVLKDLDVESENKEIDEQVKEVVAVEPETMIQQHIGEKLITEEATEEKSMGEEDELFATTTAIPNVFKHLPTLSTGRRDTPSASGTTKHNINHKGSEDGQDITETQNNEELHGDELRINAKQNIPVQLPNLIETTIKTVIPISSSVQTTTAKTNEFGILVPTQHPPIERVQTSVSISKSERVEHKKIEHTLDKDKLASDDTASDNNKPYRDAITNSDTAILKESLQNIVRSGITNQDTVAKKAISEELKNIVRSGILDLGILGLWGREPIKQTNTSPMPVFRPQ